MLDDRDRAALALVATLLALAVIALLACGLALGVAVKIFLWAA